MDDHSLVAKGRQTLPHWWNEALVRAAPDLPRGFRGRHCFGDWTLASALGVGLFFRLALGGVQNGKNREAAPVNPGGNDVWCAAHDEFACFGFAAGSPEVGMLGKPLHGSTSAGSICSPPKKNALSQSV